MKKVSLFLITLVFGMASLFALNVDESELKKFSGNTIEFINYTGPHKVIDSVEAIRAIGSGLGKSVSKSLETEITTGNKAKYYVIHAVDPKETGKLDADILIIGADATVDHVTNLRRIIGSYLESAYGYSREDADALAVFITVYNAVYRGKLEDLQGIYKNVVTKNLTADKCGLATTYKEWPGKSQIIIPLRDVTDGGLSIIDTSVISDSKVVDSMKEDDDKNVDSRKQLVDIKERESETASDKAKESQKKAVEEQKKLDSEKKKTEQVKKEADQKKKEAEKAEKKAEEKKQVAKENPNDKKAQQEANEAKKEAETAKKEAEKAEEKVEKQEEVQKQQETVTEEAKQEASKQQDFADKKQTEAQSERKEIAKDQNAIQKQEAAEAKMTTEYGLIIVDPSEMLSRLVKFDTATGEVVKNSPVSVIRNRTAYEVNDQFIAIAGENTKKGAIKLVLIDEDTMEITDESDSYIAADSVLLEDGGDYYCVVEEKGKHYVAKFGGDLSLKLKSNVEVMSCTPITFTNAGLVVTEVTGKLKILNRSDLSVVEGKPSKSSTVEISEK